MENVISRVSSREVVAFVAAGVLLLAGYVMSKTFMHPTIASAASCDLQNNATASADDPVYVVGCSGIL